MTLYFISGLGADKRAFQRIRLPDIISVKYMEWQIPGIGESLSDYALRFSKQINTTEEFSIAGLSFGGIMAIEMMKILNPRHTIIISSMACRLEIPALFRFAGLMRLNRMTPVGIFRKPTRFSNWIFGARKKDEQNLLREIISGTSPVFLSWAIERILHWKQKHRPAGLFHIHGSKDRLLPVSKTSADVIIPGGGHLMIYTHAEIISSIIVNRIKNI